MLAQSPCLLRKIGPRGASDVYGSSRESCDQRHAQRHGLCAEARRNGSELVLAGGVQVSRGPQEQFGQPGFNSVRLARDPNFLWFPFKHTRHKTRGTNSPQIDKKKQTHSSNSPKQTQTDTHPLQLLPKPMRELDPCGFAQLAPETSESLEPEAQADRMLRRLYMG